MRSFATGRGFATPLLEALCASLAEWVIPLAISTTDNAAKRHNLLLKVVLGAWAVGMVGVFAANQGYVVIGKTMVYIAGPIGILGIAIYLTSFLRKRSKSSKGEHV